MHIDKRAKKGSPTTNLLFEKLSRHGFQSFLIHTVAAISSLQLLPFLFLSQSVPNTLRDLSNKERNNKRFTTCVNPWRYG
jgi:hypothetical protein